MIKLVKYIISHANHIHFVSIVFIQCVKMLMQYNYNERVASGAKMNKAEMDWNADDHLIVINLRHEVIVSAVVPIGIGGLYCQNINRLNT